ncbi:putative damage-inducible protein DinB [Filimonas zeae]|uniref:Metal-dependent hydrolase n=1 Tax=Filimonas zeae TaxID=1737353 RepID=A0A917MT17_9BACT|nr:putative metal-dependent hydrolase [Filimonas zeae]MDR6338253.1 putative damage-inducible protein DinB [Filimonas zeae]GGH62493.1 putative metal-dependent hydrolase [Filimonas zeae]
MDDLRYPIGLYEPQPFSQRQKEKWLLDLRYMPDELETAILNLNEEQFNTPYREGGWTVTQVVHHVADSHMNAYIRFKLGLTEHNPVIKPYEEGEWAMLNDVQTVPVNLSLTLLHALHQRWVATVKDLSDAQWQRTVYHPGQQAQLSLWHLLGSYAWHGKHHVAHITSLRERRRW